MSQSIPEQLNVDRREFADAVNALTKICSSHLVGSGAGIFSSAIDSSATSVDLREGFPFQSVTVLSNEGSVHLILLARRYSTLESLDIGLSQHWSALVDGLEII
ncbi:hypothetical protein Tco_1007170 [Tanacetum coccineum]